ncbi:MAG TPA: VWA domain-containing protein, partial [Blastocatellia bacterium]|nr:VWA domain-containing protein [Blastocatellia bacterium]
MKSKRPLPLYLVALVLASYAFASSQERQSADQDQDETIKLKADLVTITAAVLDRDGHAIRSLKRDEFVVFEDGVEQKIAHFSPT